MKAHQDLPKISVITPSLNQSQFLRETIESVLSQKYPDLELIVIDGGSTDGTVALLREYGKTIKWVSEKDSGQGEAINKGMQLATGEIVCYLNSDDIFLPNALDIVGSTFRDNPHLLWLTGDCRIIDERGKRIHWLVQAYKRVLRGLPLSFVLPIANAITQPSTFWRRSASNENVVDTTLQYCMDYDLWFRLLRKSPPKILSRELAAFRLHGASKSGTEYIKQFSEDYSVAKRYVSNPFLLLLHSMHTWGFLQIYKLIKPL